MAITNASKTLRVMAYLLDYPDAAMRTYAVEIRQALLSEKALSHQRLAEIDALVDWLIHAPPLEAEANYVNLFDRGRSTSLHLFEHVHGDSRDRGPAMIDLLQTYEKAGLYLVGRELPDYLPALLQFVSTQPAREARLLLAEMTHIFNAIFTALNLRSSPYASVIGALIEIAGDNAQSVPLAPEMPMDELWTEPPAFDGCSTKGQARPGQHQIIQMVPNPNRVGKRNHGARI